MNKTLLFILVLFFSVSSLAQDKKSLKDLKKIRIEVDIICLGETNTPYPHLAIYAVGIKDDFTLELRKSKIQVLDSKNIPSLNVKITLNNNSRNVKSGSDGWIIVKGEINLKQKVVVSNNKQNIEAITWVGNTIDGSIKEENISNLNNYDFRDLINSFLLDYLEVNPY